MPEVGHGEQRTMPRGWKVLVPETVKRIVRRYRDRESRHSAHLRESTSYPDVGEPGPLIRDVFRRLRDVPGWFNVDDCGHFFLLLSYQSALGITGDVLEIGSYHGRSTALLATCLRTGERIVVCDAFDSDTDGPYSSNSPSPEDLMANVERVSPGIRDRIVIHRCLSNDLRLDAEERFRFIHIDGGHSAEQAYFDLRLCSQHLLPGGVIAMDDYHHKHWPGVTQGTDRFLRDSDALSILADLNRHGALGRKLYLMRSA